MSALRTLNCRDLWGLGIDGFEDHDPKRQDPCSREAVCECVRRPLALFLELGRTVYEDDEPQSCRSPEVLTSERLGLRVEACCSCWGEFPGEAEHLFREIELAESVAPVARLVAAEASL